jgi:hypothetical protein
MNPQPPLAQLRGMINGYQLSQAIYVAVTLGIPDQLAGGARTAAQLASVAEADPRALYRLMRALAAAGIFKEEKREVFTLTPLGELLRSDHASSFAGWAAQIGRPYFWGAWDHLLQGVKTGRNPFSAIHGEDVWSWRSKQPLENEIFNGAMTALSRVSNAAVVAAFDFARFQRIVDIGGGHGALLAAVLHAAPGAAGVLFDQPHVVEGAPPVLAESGIADRCEVVAGSMFESVPAGADAYVMKTILHDWDDARCIDILKVCRAAMSPSSRLLVIEQLIGPPNEGLTAKLSDLNMFVMPDGQERTVDEFALLFNASGLALTGVTPTASPLSIIEAIRA